MNIQHSLTAWTLGAACFGVAVASEDHGHDHGEAPASAAASSLPRFAAVSEAYELVGVVDGRRLTIYLDRFADNSPVTGATLELEVAGEKLVTESHADGEFEATLAEELQPGVVPVIATVTAGADTDLMVGELDIHEEEHAHEANPGYSAREAAPWIGAGGLALVLLVWLLRRGSAARATRTGGVA